MYVVSAPVLAHTPFYQSLNPLRKRRQKVGDLARALSEKKKDHKIGAKTIDGMKSMLSSPEVVKELGKIDKLAGLIRR